MPERMTPPPHRCACPVAILATSSASPRRVLKGRILPSDSEFDDFDQYENPVHSNDVIMV